MFIFFVKLIFLICFLGILALVFKKIPSLLRLSLEAGTEEKKFLIPPKKIINIDVEELEKKISLWLGKLFKKFRIYALKLENLSARLSIKFHERSKTLSESRKEYWEQLKNGEQAEDEQKKKRDF